MLDVIYKLSFMRWSILAAYAGWLAVPYALISVLSLLMFFDRPGLKLYLMITFSVVSCGLIPLISILKLRSETPQTEEEKGSEPAPVESKSKSIDELPR